VVTRGYGIDIGTDWCRVVEGNQYKRCTLFGSTATITCITYGARLGTGWIFSFGSDGFSQALTSG